MDVVRIGVFYADGVSDWGKSSGIDGGAPYQVWTPENGPMVGRFWTVLDRHGTNILSRGKGQVFTDEKTARELCEQWNE